jgi:hypothetical protein
VSLADTCRLCAHELYAGICTEDQCKCDCYGETYEED